MTRRPCTCASPDGVPAAPECPACRAWRAHVASEPERPRGACGICGVAFLLSGHQQGAQTDGKRVYCGVRCLQRSRSGHWRREVARRRGS